MQEGRVVGLRSGKVWDTGSAVVLRGLLLDYIALCMCVCKYNSLFSLLGFRGTTLLLAGGSR